MHAQPSLARRLRRAEGLGATSNSGLCLLASLPLFNIMVRKYKNLLNNRSPCSGFGVRRPAVNVVLTRPCRRRKAKYAEGRRFAASGYGCSSRCQAKV